MNSGSFQQGSSYANGIPGGISMQNVISELIFFFLVSPSLLLSILSPKYADNIQMSSRWRLVEPCVWISHPSSIDSTIKMYWGSPVIEALLLWASGGHLTSVCCDERWKKWKLSSGCMIGLCLVLLCEMIFWLSLWTKLLRNEGGKKQRLQVYFPWLSLP